MKMKRIIYSFKIHSHRNHSSKRNDIINIPYLSSIDSHYNHSSSQKDIKNILCTIDSHHHHWVKIGMKRTIHLYTIHSHQNHSSRQDNIKTILNLSKWKFEWREIFIHLKFTHTTITRDKMRSKTFFIYLP